MKTKFLITLLVGCTLLLPACKKDEMQLVQQTITITDLPNWVFEDGASRIKVILDADQYEKIQEAMGLVEVILPTVANINNKESLPHTTVYEGGVRITFYYKWEGAVLNIYRQIAGNAIILAGPPNEVNLVYYVVK